MQWSWWSPGQLQRWVQHRCTGGAGLADGQGLGPGEGVPLSAADCHAERCRGLGRAGPQMLAAGGEQGCCFSLARMELLTAGSG